MAATRPIIHYFPIRGRAEPIKLTLVSQGVAFDVEQITDREKIKDLTKYKFGQAPAYSDEEVDHLVQSNAILRFLARKYNLYGSSRKESAAIDEIVDSVEDFWGKYAKLIYMGQLSDDAKAEYWKMHGDPSSVTGSTFGAHWGLLARLVDASSNGFLVAGKLSIADVAVWNMLDNHLRIFQQDIESAYPQLIKFHHKFASTPAIKAYLESNQRISQNNGNGLG